MFVADLFGSVMNQEMSRSAAGKTSVTSDVFTSSETAARLADYSGTQYYFISGRSTVAAELTGPSGTTMSDVGGGLGLPPDSTDSGSEKETTAGKDHKPDNPGKDTAKVSVLCHNTTALINIRLSCSCLISACLF